MIYKNIAHVKAVLGIKPLNTGRLQNYRGVVFDDLESLHAIKSMDGSCLSLMSGIEMPLAEYRGQTREYEVCLSSLDRISNDVELFLALCRSIYFKKAIAYHPWIQYLQSTSPVFDQEILPLPICISLEGIAQHYGLPTEYLDITNNFSVASFFATQSWDPLNKKFVPMRGSDNVGVLYKVMPVFLLGNQVCDADMPYVPVGWQPFPRPEEQRANAIKLRPGQDFANSDLPVTAYRFRHDYKQSKRIYEKFEGGNKLMPHDDMADFAESLETKISFPQIVIDEAAEKFFQRKGITSTGSSLSELIRLSGVIPECYSSVKEWSWKISEEELKERLTALIDRVRCRRAFSV